MTSKARELFVGEKCAKCDPRTSEKGVVELAESEALVRTASDLISGRDWEPVGGKDRDNERESRVIDDVDEEWVMVGG